MTDRIISTDFGPRVPRYGRLVAEVAGGASGGAITIGLLILLVQRLAYDQWNPGYATRIALIAWPVLTVLGVIGLLLLAALFGGTNHLLTDPVKRSHQVETTEG